MVGEATPAATKTAFSFTYFAMKVLCEFGDKGVDFEGKTDAEINVIVNAKIRALAEKDRNFLSDDDVAQINLKFHEVRAMWPSPSYKPSDPSDLSLRGVTLSARFDF